MNTSVHVIIDDPRFKKGESKRNSTSEASHAE